MSPMSIANTSFISHYSALGTLQSLRFLIQQSIESFKFATRFLDIYDVTITQVVKPAKI